LKALKNAKALKFLFERRMNALKRLLLMSAGVLCLVLGGIGIILPLLPTTPFVLLAAACFARASPRLHQYLHNNRFFGPVLYHWQQQRAIPKRAKRLGLILLFIAASTSLWFAPSMTVRGIMLIVLLIPLLILLRLPSVEEGA
jgi:uncharacterized protein